MGDMPGKGFDERIGTSGAFACRLHVLGRSIAGHYRSIRQEARS